MTNTSTSCRFRPHSVTLGDDSTPKLGKTKPTSTSPDWHKSFKFLLSKKHTSPKINKSIKRLSESSHVESDAASMTMSVSSTFNSKNTSSANESSLVDDTSISNTENAPKVNKRPSIRSKGFSIPLNASFCLSPMPVNYMPPANHPGLGNAKNQAN